MHLVAIERTTGGMRVRDTRLIDEALLAFASLLGSDQVLTGEAVTLQYGRCTTGLGRHIQAVLKPGSTEQVQEIVRIAERFGVALSPLSTGRNWGYGSALPVRDHACIVDLSGMNRILAFNAEAGVVTLEPGVTQAQLHAWLDERNLPFMVPTTGGGPSCSIVGNALERGYGITPIADHFAAVMSLEAVLANGSLYRPLLSELGGHEVDGLFKWGIGAYLDGLFSQGNAGIVTRMTIALARRPAATCAFLFSVPIEGARGAAVSAVHEIQARLSGVVGAVNLMNAHRILAMNMDYPASQAQSGLLPDEAVASCAKAFGIGAWTGIGALYGEVSVVKAAKKVVKRLLKQAGMRQIRFITPRQATLLRRISQAVVPESRLAKKAASLEAGLQVMLGKPSEVALPLAYWRSGKVRGALLNPAQDGCGLLWFAPLLPLRPDRVQVYVDLVRKICQAHRLEPLITLTTLSERCLDSSVPLLFDPADPEQVLNAHACYDALFEACCAQGFLPYRLHINAMSRLDAVNSPGREMLQRIRQALDPKSLIAPGRY